MPITADRPLAIYYEHPDWYRPLFDELDRRGIPYVKLHAAQHRFDPAEEVPYSLVFNRMSPSAYNRGHGNAIFYTHSWLAYLKQRGVRVINGHEAYLTETSKAYQLALLESLGLPYPRARAINHASQAVAAAEDLRFPVVIKPNVGGSGAGIVRFDSWSELEARLPQIDLGPDHVALLQEFIEAEGGAIVRIEVLDGRFLYAIRIVRGASSFNLCPADICQVSPETPAAASLAACPVDAPATLEVSRHEPPAEAIEAAIALARGASIDVGGIEYLVSRDDGQIYFYDVNATSNFVANAAAVLGFDPFRPFVDYSERVAREGKRSELA